VWTQKKTNEITGELIRVGVERVELEDVGERILDWVKLSIIDCKRRSDRGDE
jgi:hypothetical protein